MTRLAKARLLAACAFNELAAPDDCPMRANSYELENALVHDVLGPDNYDWESHHMVAASMALDGSPGGRWPRARKGAGR